MSDSSVDDFFGRQAHEARGPESVVLESPGPGLGRLPGRDGVFITAPTTGGADGSAIGTQGIADQLWSAIRNDAVAQFARRFPYTVTPGAPA